MKLYFENIVRLLNEKYQVDISIFDEAFLEKTVAARIETTATVTKEAFLLLLGKDPSESLLLQESLINCYSEFFRNTLTFALLEQFLLPKLFTEKEQNRAREIRIWSAGCSAGQEAYSIAILADDYRQSSKTPVSFTIFATDNSENILETARQGMYDEKAVRNVKMDHITRYFTRKKDQFHISPALIGQVDFSRYDLLDKESVSPPASIYGDFDIIFCSNVLYYYNPEIQKRILGKLSRSLCENGFLITSEAEKSIVKLVRGFRQVVPPAPVFVKTL